jgi:hypothetical protein
LKTNGQDGPKASVPTLLSIDRRNAYSLTSSEREAWVAGAEAQAEDTDWPRSEIRPALAKVEPVPTRIESGQ